MNFMLNRRYYTVREAAELLGCHGNTVRYMLKRGSLAGEKLGDRWIVEVASVQALAAHYHPVVGRPRRNKREKSQ